ncbi:MAG TPA: FhaA domain-containing protein [Blastocatellia bacterium]|nr:FhaA domain-containing protein [Blastocatellia bacterium]
MGLHSWFESLRKWIDGEEDLDEQGQPRARSRWDDFLVAIAREIEQSMQREMFTPPGGPTYIPREYVVFLNPEDDSEWQGEKREGLERGLYHILSERAKELAGDNEFQTRTLTVELRVDPGLERGRFRVQHVWDSETQKTMVRPRKRADASVENAAQGLATVAEEREDEATIVRARKPVEPAFSILVRRDVPGGDTAPPDVRPFYKDEITIGRGSSQVKVDLRLEGDLEVSRTHAILTRREDEFTILCQGANPILLEGNREIPANESATVRPGDKIIICSYELILQ